jgi:CubicO group peptidase (beta-lactamase class C family)
MQNGKVKILFVAGILLTLTILVVIFYPRLGIATGFAAKAMCSCVFVGDRQMDEVKQNVLYHSILPWADLDVDNQNKTVSASIFGLQTKKAYYKEGAGCILSPSGQTPDFIFSRNDMIFGEDTMASPFQWTEGSTFGLDKDKLNKAVESVFDKEENKPEKRTTAVLVIHRDTLVAEMYARPFDKNKRQLGWSMTKSLMNTFVGLMVQNGKVDLANKNLFQNWQDDNRKNITVNDLLLMSSGLDWEEDYTKVSDVTKMLYESPDVTMIPLQKKLTFEPGKKWKYGSGQTNLISKYLRDQFANDEAYHSYLYRRLFIPLGMESMILETDAKGNFIGSSYAFATPRDWARFGLLYLHDGVWLGKRLLPDYWVNYTRTPAADSQGKYGAHFWLNKGFSHFKNAPDDMFFADGYQGQYIFIIPSLHVVIVRLGAGEDGFDANNFLKEVVASFPTGQ